jgi:hypothetical protein
VAPEPVVLPGDVGNRPLAGDRQAGGLQTRHECERNGPADMRMRTCYWRVT